MDCCQRLLKADQFEIGPGEGFVLHLHAQCLGCSVCMLRRSAACRDVLYWCSAGLDVLPPEQLQVASLG